MPSPSYAFSRFRVVGAKCFILVGKLRVGTNLSLTYSGFQPGFEFLARQGAKKIPLWLQELFFGQPNFYGCYKIYYFDLSPKHCIW